MTSTMIPNTAVSSSEEQRRSKNNDGTKRLLFGRSWTTTTVLIATILFVAFPLALVFHHSNNRNEVSILSGEGFTKPTTTNASPAIIDPSSLLFGKMSLTESSSVVSILEKEHVDTSYTGDLPQHESMIHNNHTERKTLHVHIVPHTHDDVGWLKTVDQYYYGLNNTIQHASVKYILDTTIRALLEDSKRKFTYVETAYFHMWWKEQSSSMKQKVQTLVQNGQLVFVNGGWCMHDEAATHYMGMIDQTTRGHSFLSQTFSGYTPSVGWQLDPFGHSSTHASYMSAEMGFNSLFFGRIDHQDLSLRQNTSQCEGIWKSSPQNLQDDAQVFWGLTGSYHGNYGAPQGFFMEAYRDDEPLVKGYNLEERLELWFDALMWQANRTKGDHIMITMGSDFAYENAFENYERIDQLIQYTNDMFSSKENDISRLGLGSYTDIHAFYSDPATYTEAKYQEQQQQEQKTQKGGSANNYWQVKTDDFFPYSDCDDCFWTGYFTSRPALKKLERVASSFLHAARQVEALTSLSIQTQSTSNDDSVLDSRNITTTARALKIGTLDSLEDGISILQHHDGVSGTSKQHVADDYAKRVDIGMQTSSKYMAELLSTTPSLFARANNAEDVVLTPKLSYCPLLNESICELTQDATQLMMEDETASNEQGKPFAVRTLYVVAYNALAQSRSDVLRIPVSASSTDVSYEVTNMVSSNIVESVVIPNINYSSKNDTSTSSVSPYHLYFEANDLAPLKATKFVIKITRKTNEEGLSSSSPSTLNKASNDDAFTATLLGDTLKQVSIDFGYYTSYAKEKGQKSGAYIFRPNETNQELILLNSIKNGAGPDIYVSPLISELHMKVNLWMKYVTRTKRNQPSYIEVEYTVGPIPVKEDGMGKEIVARYTSRDIINDGIFYTDSNGREFQKRILSYRPTWEYDEHQPVAGNYYPVNAAIYIEGINYHKSMTVLTDRSQGGTSLKNGTIDLMVHRRTIADDSRGVGEPIDETQGGMTPYPPYGNSERLGEGLIITGVHKILLSSEGGAGASLARSQMDHTFSPIHLFFASSEFPEETTESVRKVSTTPIEVTAPPSSGVLPPNLALLTFMRLSSSQETHQQQQQETAPPQPKQPSQQYLIRVGHQYSKGEGPLAKTVLVDMKNVVLIPSSTTITMEELTLSGNQLRHDWETKRYHWNAAATNSTSTIRSTACAVSNDVHNTTFRVVPMKICTFRVTSTAGGTSSSTAAMS